MRRRRKATGLSKRGSRAAERRLSLTLQQAISKADSAGHLFVAAAGNNGSNNDTTPSYPASYNNPNIISVAATSDRDALASFSNFGATTVDLPAPGVSILSTLPGNRYGSYSGTSMATPHVTGVAALVKSNFPGLDDAQIKGRILQSVDKKASLQGTSATGANNSFAGAGEIVTDQATADALPKVEEIGVAKYYVQDLLEIDQELRKGYIELYEKEGYDAVVDVGVNPKTSFNLEQVEPQISETGELDELARVLGDGYIRENSFVRRRMAIRADEGSPILIGSRASIHDRVTFHAIKGAEIQIGEYLAVGDDAVLHGPLEMGNDNVVGEQAVVFRARVGDNVQIGEGAVIAGPAGKELTLEIPDDAIIPAGAVVTSEKDLKALTN